jgi:S-adenosylmethionine:tRNA ribosyltransferase-isomerase
MIETKWPDVKMADFTYSLPDERIPRFPLQERDQSKLLVYNKGEIAHKKFFEIGNSLPSYSLLVFNDTRVIAARLFFRTETDAQIEVLLLQPADGEEVNLSLQNVNKAMWYCMVGNRKKWKEGVVLHSEWDIDGKTVELQVSLPDHEKNEVLLEWTGNILLSRLLDYVGTMPLPPYLHREAIEADKESYQTVYARNLGAVAAPTAGLHFTDSLLDNLKKEGHDEKFVTLHVGAGTFLPVKVEKASEHAMHAETFRVSKELIAEIYAYDRPVIAVGTTSLRTLESLYWVGVQLLNIGEFSGKIMQDLPYQETEPYTMRQSFQAILNWLERKNLQELCADTSIMIMPGYEFRVIKGLITNFHQPNSTLLLLISALIGKDWKQLYELAMENEYRFLSFGDSSLLLPKA